MTRRQRFFILVSVFGLATVQVALMFRAAWYRPPLNTPVKALPPEDLPFTQETGRGGFFPSVKRNKGRPDCSETSLYPFSFSGSVKGAGDTGYQGEVYLLPPESGRASGISFSPNTIKAGVLYHAPFTLIVNQNFHPDWKAFSMPGKRPLDPFPEKGLLAVSVSSPVEEVVFQFRPSGLHYGLLLSLPGFIVSGSILLRATRKTG